MPSYRMTDFSDINGGGGGDNVSDASKSGPRIRRTSGGCHVSTVTGFVLLLLVIVAVVGVAVVVYFASDRDLKCSLDGSDGLTSGGIQGAVTSCKSWVENGGTASEQICGVCPSLHTTAPAATTTTSTPPLDRHKYRLPASITPSHYALRLQPSFYGTDPRTFYFEGSVTIDVTCHEDTTVITLHTLNISIADADVSVLEKASGGSVGVVSTSYDWDTQMYRIHLAASLRKDLDYRVMISRFSGPLKNDGRGLYYTSYLDGDQVVYLVASQLESTSARKVFPCFDEPGMKATFKITMLRKTDLERRYHTLSNMNLSRTDVSSTPGWVEDVYPSTMKMSTYLLGFVVSDFEHMSNITMGVRYSTWAPPHLVQQVAGTQELGLQVLEYCQGRFRPSYTRYLDKLDNVAVSGRVYAGMENWGVVRYGESLIHKPGVTTLYDEEFNAYVIAHEIAHMWFGNMVSPKWWDWLWLKEAVATFWEMQIIDDLFPYWRMTDEHIVDALYPTMVSDAVASSHPMSAVVASPAEISSMYSAVTYRKGGFVIRMMHFIMGPDNFVAGLNTLVEDHAEGNIDPTDLWTALNQFSPPGVNMSDKMEPWVSQIGFPVVMVTRPGNGMLHLEQRRFLMGSATDVDPRYSQNPYGYKWDIPITMATSNNPNFTQTGNDIVWMERDRQVTSMVDPTHGEDRGWFVLNVQQYGYYRILYDQHNWLNLIHQLNSNHKVIHHINRAQIINDAWNLVKVDMLDFATALKTVEYLSKERDYLPWRAFAMEMNYVLLLIDRSELYSAMETFLRDLVSGPLQQLGVDITPDQEPLDSYLRIQLAELACSHGHSTCVNLAQQQFSDWMTTGTNRINANHRQLFYCTAVQRGGQAEWSFVLEKLHSEREIAEKPRLRRALSCSADPALLRRLLNIALTSNDSQAMGLSEVIADVAANRWGRDVSFQFVVEHFSVLSSKLGSGMTGVVSSITAHFSSEYDLHRLDLLESSGDTSAVASAIKQARTQTQSNMQWLRTHLTTLQDWLHREEEEEERLDYRLPGHVKPRHYQVELKPNLYGDDPSAFTFEGSVVILVDCNIDTDVITLHVDRLNISDDLISVKQVNSAKELYASSTYEQQRHFWRLQLRESLQSGKQYELRFPHFSGPLRADGTGLYLSQYRDGQRTVYLATTQMEPPYARKTFPCFDEPQLKATFDITLVRRTDTSRNYNCRSNAPYQDTQSMTDAEGHSWAKDRFEWTPVMPTYLLAFLVSDFTCTPWENKTLSDPNVTYRTCARPNAVQWAGRAQVYGLQLFDWLNQHFQPKYSHALSKLDNVAVPDFSFGAMENWGLVIYREAILYQPGVTSARYHNWMASVITHELAHMWFGDYVSPKWWDWLWLNEAFASWWDVFATQQVFPDWNLIGDWVSSSVYNVMDSDALSTSHPMTADVMTPTEIGAIFDDVTYSKGAAIIRMMHFIMGFDTFVEGLNMYLKNHLYGNAEAADLFSALDQVMLMEGFGSSYMSTKMDPWVSQMGYPVVSVTRTQAGYHVTQKRFLIGSADNVDDRYKDAPYNYQWEIPIVYATAENPNMEKSRDDILWLSKNSDLLIPDAGVNDTDSWILLNVEQMAYYRVMYDSATWQALIGQLNRDPSVIPAINRGQIINDAWNLAKGGLLDMSVALSTLEFLEAETELVPWRAFAREMHYVQLMLETTDLFPLLQMYMRDTLQKPLQTVTLDIDEDMAPTDVFVRTLIAEYACSYGLVGCVNVAKRMFTEWKNTGVNEINANLRSQFYCTAVAEGDSSDWQFVYNQYKSADDTTELNNLRHALSCSRDQTLIRRLLSMTLDPAEIRFQDMASTIGSVADNPQGRDLAFQFFVDNFQHIKDSLEVLYLGRVLTYVTAHFNTDFQLQQLEQLPQILDMSSISPVLHQTLSRTRSNRAWLQDNYDVLRDWLTRQEPTPTPPTPGAYRLPEEVAPYHYTVSLQPHMYHGEPEHFFFEGNVTILVTCLHDTSVITLHQDRLEIDPSFISVTDFSVELPVDSISEDKQFHFYKIHMQSPLRAGRNYSLQFQNFRGQLRRSGEGLYLSSYKDGDSTIYLATTQMEPTYARQVFPCFDEPALKATFTTSLLRRTDTDRDYITLSNMPNVSSEVINESWTKDTFQKSMKMPTYLLAFIVCDYLHLANVSAEFPSVTTRTFARPNRIEDAHTAHEYSVKLFDWYNSQFQPPYETYLPKVDHIAIPDFTAGAMENWGLITYRENLLYNSMSTAGDRSWVAAVPSHELAHMWFGNKVSPKWWTWLWLNEAFASYFESFAVEQLYSEWKLWSEVDMAAGVMSVMQQPDSYSSSHPLSRPVESPAQIESQFDSITYTKGGAIIGMMHMIMGEHFIPALNVYLHSNLEDNAEHKDLFDSLNQYIDLPTSDNITLNMTEKMEPWVTQMGYPVINVKRHANSLHLTQERFLLGSAAPDDTGPYGYKFEVPITYTTSSEKNFYKPRTEIMWMSADGSPLEIPITTDDDWAVINLRHQGYYRVNYDLAMWKALIGQLNANPTALHPMNRATLMDDAFNLVKAGLLPLEVALQTWDFMVHETEYGPWRVFARETDYVEQMIERTELFPDFQRFMQAVVDKPLKENGFDLPPDNDPPIVAFKMSWIVSDACKYDHESCVRKATSTVSEWMMGLSNEINVNLRSTMYCTAVREGGHDVWDFIFAKYQEEQDAREKSRLRSALGCSKDPTILNTFLDMCLYDEEVPKSETSSCVSAVADNRYGRDVAVNFVWEHFPHLKNSFPSSTLSSMVSTVTAHFCNNFHLAQLQFLSDTYDVSGISRTLDMIRQRTVTNMKWIDNNYDTVKQWLAVKTSGPSVKLNYRLPTSVIPHHYDLELWPEIYGDDPEAFTFNGTVYVSVEVKEPTSTITLHSYRLDEQTIRDSARLLHNNLTDLNLLTEVTFDVPRHFLILSVSRELLPGERFLLYLEFSAKLPGDGVGLYYTSYRGENGSPVYLATTKFEAPYARRAFPCFDEPALKATVNVKLIRRREYNGRQYRSWSNNKLLRTEDKDGVYVKDIFQETPITPTYLLAFIVADFLCLSDDINSLNYSTCARPSGYMHGHLAQTWGVELMTLLEDYFDPPYPMPKIDNMAIPNFLSGAMENWGLITYRESILYEKNVTSAGDKSWTAEVVAHELVHMWFGNIVSPQWWNWLWLNEAFASFWDFALVDVLNSTWRQTDQFVVQSMHSVMALDSLTSSHPMTADVESPTEIQSIFDSITYSKGAAIVRMMDFIMGRDDFIAALNVYLADNEYTGANHTHLFDSLDKYLNQSHQPLRMTEVMEPWVTQMNLPVVHVRWDRSGEVTLTQRRFLSTGEGAADDEAPFGYTWDIPVTMATSTSPRENVNKADIVWFNKSDSHVTISNSSIPAPPTLADSSRWILLNVRQYGYYRVNYPHANWLALIDQLKRDPTVIPVINRGQIINDAWSLAKSGLLNMSIALQTLQVLQTDSDYVPWRAISGELSYLDLMLSRTAIYGLFQDYMVQLVEDTYDNSSGFDSNSDEPPIDSFQRERIVSYACKYGVVSCWNEARQRFSDWKSDPENKKLQVDTRGTLLCVGIEQGSKEDWEFVFQRYLHTHPGSEHSDLLAALSCSRDVWLLHRLMDLTLDSSVISAQDVRSVLESVSSNPIGRDMAFTFLQDHFQQLPAFMTTGSFGRMVLALTNHFNTQHQLDELKLFMAQTDISIAQSSFRQAVEQTSVNVQWMKDYYQHMRQFLQDNVN